MSTSPLSHEELGVLRLVRDMVTPEDFLSVKAALEDLPGVHAIEFKRDGVSIRFDPELSSEAQFYEAVKIAGFPPHSFKKIG